jgi:hypothetical protein
LAAHQLSDIQQVEQLHQLPPLANQKLLELLAPRCCAPVSEYRRTTNTFFGCLFLNKLHRELSKADMDI